jgi:hypothetical protein
LESAKAEFNSMPHNFFLSHYNRDKVIAEIIGSTLSRISLKQISPWFSSDSSGDGGLKPGNIWFNEILAKIKQSKALVAVITPNSINRSWIYFESGIAQSLEGCEIIPVCVGIKRDDVPAPLGMYQCYQLTDYKSFKEFVGKLLARFDIDFDEEMTKPILENALLKLAESNFPTDPGKPERVDVQELLSEIKSHIDLRFVDLIDRYQTTSGEKKSKKQVRTAEKDDVLYTISLRVKMPGFKGGPQYLEIRESDTVQDCLDSIYFLISNYVEAYTYMGSWILKNYKSSEKLVMGRIIQQVPARFVFTKDKQWEVIKLSKPYTAGKNG